MGRKHKGRQTVYEVLRIELQYLQKRGYIKRGCLITGSLEWLNTTTRETTASTLITTSYQGGDQNYIELTYTVNSEVMRYKVNFIEAPSNLGSGYILFFICPETKRRCKILYAAYGSKTFKSRYAYKHRLYYDCQASSKLWKYCNYYWRLEDKLENIKETAKAGNRKYRGVPTKAAQRFLRYRNKQIEMDYMRWTKGVPKSLQGSVFI